MKIFYFFLVVPFLLYGCNRVAIYEVTAYSSKDEITEIENQVTQTDASIYRFGYPSVLDDMDPMITFEVSTEEFLMYNELPESIEQAVNCIFISTIQDEKTVDSEDDLIPLGLFHVSDNGELNKICTKNDCRIDKYAKCDHISQPSQNSAIWYKEAAYYIGKSMSLESGRVDSYFILRWQDGDTTFEKIFETERYISELYVCNGILYVASPQNMVNDVNIYYAINIEKEIYATIQADGSEYVFGDQYILMYNQAGTFITNPVLKAHTKCCDSIRPGVIRGDEYWFWDNYNIYNVNLAKPEKVNLVIENVGVNYAVCGDYIYYVPNENNERVVLFHYRDKIVEKGKVTLLDTYTPYIGSEKCLYYKQKINSDGSLGKAEQLWQNEDNKWLQGVNTNGNMGKYLSFQTITPGNDGYVRYFTQDHITDGERSWEIGTGIQS